jgi:AcrR family transcriptional regulator
VLKPRKLDEGVPPARREEILDAATELFAEHGFSEMVTQMLAERLGVGKGTIYRYFPSKCDLFLAAVDRGMSRLRERVDARIAGVDEPLERIALAVRTHLEFFAEHPEYVELLIQERALFKDRSEPTFIQHRRRNAERWRGVYRALIAEGRVREIEVERIIEVAGNLIYGTMFTNYFTGQHRPFEEQARDILDIVFFGILSESERRSQGLG